MVRPSSHIKVWWQCDDEHEWQAAPTDRTRPGLGTNCPRCARRVSSGEAAIAQLLTEAGVAFEQSNRTVLAGLELDIYCPAAKLAIEFNGVYWHSEAAGKQRAYHQLKWRSAQAAGIQLLQIWEDDWQQRRAIVSSMILHKLGVLQQPKLGARKLQVHEVTAPIARDFLTVTHLQGYASGTLYLGLANGSELVALMVCKMYGAEMHIIRYATACHVAGGFTRLLKSAIRKLAPEKVYTFSDHMVSTGALYANHGFQAVQELAPDYTYLVGGVRRHKFSYRLARFRQDPKLSWADNLTERELAQLNGLPRVWDAGKTKWLLDVKAAVGGEIDD